MNSGTLRLAPITNRRELWRTSAVFSASGPTMLPGVSHSIRIGMSKASQSCMKRAALSEPSRSMAPPRCLGLLAMMPMGRPSMRASAVTMPVPNCLAQLQHRTGIAQRLDHIADVIDAQPVLRDRAPEQALIGAIPVRQRALEIGEIFLGHRHRFGFVLHHHVDHAVGRLHRHGPDILRVEHAQPAAFDHRRPAHADGGILGRDDHIAAAQQRRIAGEAVAGIDADQRHQPRQLGKHAGRS